MSTAQPSHRHTFSLVTSDKPGVLVRIALVFARRSYNIESLAVSPGGSDGFSRMTIVSRGDPENSDQILKQLAKLVDVVFVTDHRGLAPVESEVALVKLRCQGAIRQRAMTIAEQHGARAKADGEERVIVNAHGTSAAIDALLGALAACNVEEVVRSGKVVMDPGASAFAHLLR